MTQLSGLKRSMPCIDLCSMTDRPSPSSYAYSDDEDDASATSCMVSFPSILQADDLEFLIDDVLELSIQGNISFKRQRRDRDLTKAPLMPATAALEAALAESQSFTMEQLEYTNIELLNSAYIADWAALNESSKPTKFHSGSAYQSYHSCMPCSNNSLTQNLSRMSMSMA